MWKTIAICALLAYVLIFCVMLGSLGGKGEQTQDPSTPREDDEEGPPY